MAAQSRLPDGFELLRSGGTTAVVRSSVKDQVLALGIMDEAAFEQTLKKKGLVLSTDSGRAGAVSVPLDEDTLRQGVPPTRAVVRRCRRGGLLGRVLGGCYFGPSRPIREIRVSEAARAAGVPTSECLAAVVRRRWLFYSAAVITRELPGAVTLDDWLRQDANPASEESLSAIGPPLAEAFLRLVLARIYHPDLHAGNVLIQIENGRPRVHIIDFDKAVQLPELPLLGGHTGPPLPLSLQKKMLFRLNRALAKRGLAPQPVTLSVRVRFLRLLGLAKGPGEMRRLLAECNSHLRRHSWRYRK